MSVASAPRASAVALILRARSASFWGDSGIPLASSPVGKTGTSRCRGPTAEDLASVSLCAPSVTPPSHQANPFHGTVGASGVPPHTRVEKPLPEEEEPLPGGCTFGSRRTIAGLDLQV